MTAAAQNPVLWVVLAYFIGAVPTGVLLARAKGIDLRTVGSGNIGATNAMRALGTKLGLVVFACDALKAAIPVWLASSDGALGREAAPALACVAFAAVLGHVFSVYLRFAGGKGVACAFGVFLALDPRVAVAAIVLYGQGLWLARSSAVGSLTAVTGIVVSVVLADGPWPYRWLALALAALIWWRHLPNIRSIRSPKPRRET